MGKNLKAHWIYEVYYYLKLVCEGVDENVISKKFYEITSLPLILNLKLIDLTFNISIVHPKNALLKNQIKAE